MLPYLLVLLAVAVTLVQGECNDGCLTPLAPYEEMGCEPVFVKSSDCCPSHYNCSKIVGRSVDKCYYQGNVYKKGESISSELTSRHCLAACFCPRNGANEFICAHIDCPEFFGVSDALKPGCYRAYELNKCCSTQIICPPFNNVAKCQVNGKTYYEGQKWEDAENKLSCVCGLNFKGKLEEPFCRAITCGIELTHSHDVHKRCAPIFYGISGKCPIQWNCYSKGEEVIPNLRGITSEQKCQYGKEQLNIGDRLLLKLSPGRPKVDCECKIPPLVTCVQQPYDS